MDHLYIIEILGLIAGACTALSFLPQVVKVWQTKSVNDISLGMYVLLCVGVILWIFYGIFLGSIAVIAANIVTLSLAFTVLMMKLRWQRGR